jgi:hypothetical protein
MARRQLFNSSILKGKNLREFFTDLDFGKLGKI